MKRMLWTKAIVPLATATAALAVASPALAVNCDTLTNPLYITGSSAAKPFESALAQALSGTTTLVFATPGSCNGPDAIFNGTKLTGTASFWDPTMGATGGINTCTINPATGVTVDVGVSDVFSTSCANIGAVPTGVGDFFGPNQVMSFVVPTASSQTMISYEAAYFVFGFGQAGMVMPWNNEQFLFIRKSDSGTASMLAAGINVPATKWKGQQQSGSGAVFTGVSASATPEATIGILSADWADGSTLDTTSMQMVPNRTKIKTLAYQHLGQDCAWLPDSSSTAYDKKNVRDGHYPLWGPLHFFAKIDATSKLPSNPAAAKFIGYFTGTVAPPINLLQVEIQSHTIPACAMHVQRSTEVGPVSTYKSTTSCDCYFDFTATGATTCKTCTQASDCTAANTGCTMYGTTGYCEAK